jgi:hypothetical protein
MTALGLLASGLRSLTRLPSTGAGALAEGWTNGAATVTTDNPEGAVEVVLRQAGTKIECTVTWPDGEASERYMEAGSLHHAKREVKAWLAGDGFVPVDRWRHVGTDGNQIVRHFLRRPALDRIPTSR